MKRRVQLLGDKAEEKAWAAAWILSQGQFVVPIDEIGDFLRARQIDAAAVKFHPDDPHTRYALPPSVTKWPRGWEDSIIAGALSRAVDHKTLRHEKVDGINHFCAVAVDNHDIWSYENTATPPPRAGFQTPSHEYKVAT